MKKNLAALILAGLCAMSATCFADTNLPASDKLNVAEKIMYGTVQNGSFVQRTDALEEEIYGSVSKKAVVARIDDMYSYMTGKSSKGASFLTKLNVIEWRLNDSMSVAPAKTRIEEAEKLLNGQVGTGSVGHRLENLLKLAAYTDGKVPVEATTMPKDCVLKIEFVEQLSTKTSKAGDPIKFKAAENTYLNTDKSILVIPKGALGIGKITKVVQPGIFGKDGRIDMEFSEIYAIDGTSIQVTVGDLAKQKMASYAGAAGASVGGLIILGPVGLVGGAFVKGASVTIEPGAVTYVQTVEDTPVQGVIYE